MRIQRTVILGIHADQLIQPGENLNALAGLKYPRNQLIQQRGRLDVLTFKSCFIVAQLKGIRPEIFLTDSAAGVGRSGVLVNQKLVAEIF
jgi:hypothetical protein